MISTRVFTFLMGVISTAGVFLLTAATNNGNRVDARKEWPEYVRTIESPTTDAESFYRKYEVEDLDIYFSEAPKWHPHVVIMRRKTEAPWIVLDPDSSEIHDKSKAIISASSRYTPGVIDCFSYASQRDGKMTYYGDHNLDGQLDVITSHSTDAKDESTPVVRVYIDNKWYELTDERYFEGEWIPEAKVHEAFAAKKKENENYSRAKTPEGLRIVKWTRGMPSFAASVE